MTSMVGQVDNAVTRGPNNRLQAIANNLRSYVASTIGGASSVALDDVMRVLAVASVLAASIAGCSGSEISGTALEVFGPLTPRTKGGLASQWSFTSSGQVTSSFGAVVDFTYRVEGNQLKTVYLQAGKAQEETTEEFVLSGDTLTLNPIDTQKKQ